MAARSRRWYRMKCVIEFLQWGFVWTCLDGRAAPRRRHRGRLRIFGRAATYVSLAVKATTLREGLGRAL
jgi:hypothetical protein